MPASERLPLSSQPYLEDRIVGDPPRLLAGACEACGHQVFPPPAVCPVCMGEHLRAVPISRRGTLYSYSYLPQGAPGFDSPYVIAYVDMPEGVRIFTQLVCSDPAMLACGMHVELTHAEAKIDRYGRAVGRFAFAPATGN